MFNENEKIKKIMSALNRSVSECNDPEAKAFIEVGEKIKTSAFNNMPSSDFFQEKLKNKILEARRIKNTSMWDKFLGFFHDLSIKKVVPAVAFVLVVAIVSALFNFLPQNKVTNLFISAAFAKDNFQVEPTMSDSIGIESETSFVIKSKEAISDINVLKNNISLTPATEFELEKINDHEFKLTPKEDLQNKKLYKFKISSVYINEKGLTVDDNYSWAFQVKDKFKVISTLPRTNSSDVPVNSGIEFTFSHANVVDFEKGFSIEPKVEGRFEKHNRTMVFVPKALQAGKMYTVHLSQEIGIEGSTEKLDKEYEISFETMPEGGSDRGHEIKYVGFIDNVFEYPTAVAPYFPVYTNGSFQIETDTVNTKVYAFRSVEDFSQVLKQKDNIPYWAYHTKDQYKIDVSQLSLINSFDLKLQKMQDNNFLVLPGQLPAGFYYISISKDGVESFTIFQVTDISVYIDANIDKILVWANNTNTKMPVSGAEVRNSDFNTSAKTNNEGVATFDTPQIKESDQGKQTYFSVHDGGQAVVVPISLYDRKLNASDKYWNYFYQDRSLYKPNDEINFWGFIKGRDKNEELPKYINIQLVNMNFNDYYYDQVVVLEDKVEVGKGGSYSGKMKLDNILPGFFYLKVSVGDKPEDVLVNKYITVEKFEKPLYKIDVKADREAVYVGEDVNFDIKTLFFDGTPVPEVKLSYYDGGESHEITTDINGMAKVRIKANPNCGGSCNYSPITQYFEVQPIAGELGDIRAGVNFRIYSSDVIFSDSQTKLKDGKVIISATVKNVDLNKSKDDFMGDFASGKKVLADVTKVDYVRKERGEYYNFIDKKTYKSYDYERVQTSMPALIATTGKDGKVVFEFPAEEYKTYEIRLEASGNNGKNAVTSLYQYAAKNLESDDYDWYSYYHLQEKEPHQYGYSVGERVEIAFMKNGNEFRPDSGKFLFLTKSLGLRNAVVTESNNYGFKFEKQDIPNVSLTGVYFDGVTYRRSSNQYVSYKQKDSEIKFDIKADKEKYKPGEEAKLSIKSTDKDGEPVQAHINIDLVDEALVAIGGKEFVNPSGQLYSALYDGSISSAFTHLIPVFFGGGAEMGCFLDGTKILMAGGQEKNIENIKVGDTVLTFESEQKNYLVQARVSKVMVHTVNKYLIINNNLRVTPEHRVYLNGVWQMIGHAKIGDNLLGADGMPVIVEKIEEKFGPVRVYNFEVEKYHTYIANGIYVHNDKGDGRSYMPDTALFQSLETDSDGEATITFKLPDNLTSWLVTVQGVSNDLFVGTGSQDIIVSLPAFVEMNLADQYLLGDKPDLRLRAYGEKLNFGDSIKYYFESKDLGVEQVDKNGQAFSPVYFSLDNLKIGINKITAGIESSFGNDRLTKSVEVVDSHLQEQKQEYYDLSEGLSIHDNPSGWTTLVFTDKNRGRYYYDVVSLGWGGGMRVDQKLSGVVSQQLLNKYFKEEKTYNNNFDFSVYQTSDGGISLLSYSSADIILSAKVASVASDYFDKSALSNYFYKILNNSESNREEVVLSLWGLASVDEPVLLPIREFVKVGDLKPIEKIYLAMASYKVGDFQLARSLYGQILQNYGLNMDPYIKIKISNEEDENIEATLLTSILAAGLNDDQHEGMWKFVSQSQKKDILVNLEKMMYLNELLPNTTAGESQFTLELRGKKEDIKLVNGDFVKKVVNNEDLKNIKFTNIHGDVGVTAKYMVKVSEQNASGLLRIRKAYFSDKGVEASTFREGDLVEIRLYPEFDKDALSGRYVITDYLPSGLRAAVGWSSYAGYDFRCGFYYPNESDRNVVEFEINKNWKSKDCNKNYINYRARVVGTGTFVSESVVMQSSDSSKLKTYSDQSEIKIERR